MFIVRPEQFREAREEMEKLGKKSGHHVPICETLGMFTEKAEFFRHLFKLKGSEYLFNNPFSSMPRKIRLKDRQKRIKALTLAERAAEEYNSKGRISLRTKFKVMRLRINRRKSLRFWQ